MIRSLGVPSLLLAAVLAMVLPALPACAGTNPAPAPAATAPVMPRPFGRDTLAGIRSGRSGEPFLLVLWSADCPPCLKEFREFAALRAQGRDLPLVLVSTDDPARAEEVAGILREFRLSDVENWIFGDADAQPLRYAVDPRWYGELPRGYFYDRDGNRRAHSGGLTAADLTAWLDAAGLNGPR